jgi:hypothetical protein
VRDEGDRLPRPKVAAQQTINHEGMGARKERGSFDDDGTSSTHRGAGCQLSTDIC